MIWQTRAFDASGMAWVVCSLAVDSLRQQFWTSPNWISFFHTQRWVTLISATSSTMLHVRFDFSFSPFFKNRLLFPGCVMIEQEWLTKKVQTIEIIILSLVFLSVRDRVKGKLFLCGFQVDARWDEARGERHRLKPELPVSTNCGTFKQEPFFRWVKFLRVLPLLRRNWTSPFTLQDIPTRRQDDRRLIMSSAHSCPPSLSPQQRRLNKKYGWWFYISIIPLLQTAEIRANKFLCSSSSALLQWLSVLPYITNTLANFEWFIVWK